jgi:hypothetical protein
MARHPARVVVGDDIYACGVSLDGLQELWLGPGPLGSTFRSREELEDAWVRGRDVVMRLWGQGGRRPQAWWYLGDAAALGLKFPGHSSEQSYLYDHGVLSEVERTELLASWRREFDRDRSPAHLNWADVPHSLREQWLAEHPTPSRKTHRNTSRRAAPAPLNESG